MADCSSLVSLSPKCTEAMSKDICPANELILRQARNSRRVKKRTYFKAVSAFSAYRKHKLRWITLTTSPENSDKFQKNWRKLIMRLRRKGLVNEYLRVPERTPKGWKKLPSGKWIYVKGGTRHEHILFLGSYIQQHYLSYLWKKISGDAVVWISKVGLKTAQYLAKYASKCPEWRVSNSRSWCRRRLCGEWADWKRACRELHIGFKEMLAHWKNTLFLNVNAVDFYWFLCDGASCGS